MWVEAKVIKKPVKETKTVEVELTHEELVIEKRPVEYNKTSSSTSPSEDIAESKIEISFALKFTRRKVNLSFSSLG